MKPSSPIMAMHQMQPTAIAIGHNWRQWLSPSALMVTMLIDVSANSSVGLGVKLIDFAIWIRARFKLLSVKRQPQPLTNVSNGAIVIIGITVTNGSPLFSISPIGHHCPYN
jgi:hypothetical protein